MTAYPLFDMTMSLDRVLRWSADDRTGQEMGQGGFRLFNWLDDRDGPGPNGEVYAEAWPPARSSPAGGRSIRPAAGTATITTASRSSCSPTTSPRTMSHPASARFYTDVGECAAAAREGAGGKDVMVHGAGAARALIRAGELDEIEVHVAPGLLGAGRRLFDGLEDLESVELEAVRAVQGRDATHLRYRVVRPPEPRMRPGR